MKPVSFKYFAPTTTAEAVEILGRYGADAKVLAGGQSLMPLLNMRLARPAVLVDLNRIAELDYIRSSAGSVAIGAIARQRQLENDPLIAERVPLLKAAARLISHPQLRNRGTIVGSIAHGDPSAELPAAALALNADVTAVGISGTRTLSVDALYLGYMVTALNPEEMLTEVRFPALPAGTGWAIQEMARRHGDFALAGVVALLRLQGTQIAAARVAYFGLGGRACCPVEVEKILVGASPSNELFTQAAARATAVLEAGDDIHASAEYRRAIAGVLTRRTLSEALARAQQGARS